MFLLDYNNFSVRNSLTINVIEILRRIQIKVKLINSNSKNLILLNPIIKYKCKKKSIKTIQRK